MKKKIFIISSVLIVGAIALYFIFSKKTVVNEITIKPKYGTFVSNVTSTGELKAKNSIDIRGADNARSIGIWQMKITNLVDEGKIVKTGDFVAELDKSEILNKLKESQLQMQKIESQLVQARLDSSLTLSQARDDLENQKFMLEEKLILIEQSKFEAPAIIRQAEIDYEKIKRNFEQSKKNYETKVKQAIAKLTEIFTDYQKQQQQLERLTETLNQFTILAPADGMVIYAREWDGRRIVVGSTVSAWEPIVATLPDLNTMESVTYINEVDIQKIKLGQSVKIGLDANPDKKLTGKVSRVANIGEQKKGSDTKVFEVIVEVADKDTTLLPAMTTSNEILISSIPNSTYIPLECVHSEETKNGKKHYVYLLKKGKPFKKYIEIGEMNESEVIVKSGISKKDELYLSIPEQFKASHLIPKK